MILPGKYKLYRRLITMAIVFATSEQEAGRKGAFLSPEEMEHIFDSFAKSESPLMLMSEPALYHLSQYFELHPEAQEMFTEAELKRVRDAVKSETKKRQMFSEMDSAYKKQMARRQSTSGWATTMTGTSNVSGGPGGGSSGTVTMTVDQNGNLIDMNGVKVKNIYGTNGTA